MKRTSSSSRKNREFKPKVRQQLAERVAFMCSNPLCRRLTVKRAVEGDRAIHQGKASHILPASPSGPRAEESPQPDEACRSQENGIWLCDIHAREVDDNREKYPADLLRQWKAETERYVEELVTQDTRLRQLRVMMSPLLSALRLLTALPGPGPTFDQTFESPGRIPVTRLLIEAEQTLFENGFPTEADHLLRIKSQLEHIYTSIRYASQSSYLNISDWKNRTIKLLMIDVMRFSQESYRRHLDREMEMVQSRLRELAGTPVIPFTFTEVERKEIALTGARAQRGL